MAGTDTIGFKGQPPHNVFQQYMEMIVSSEPFAGMPDARYDDGRIQWEAPSNRTGGKFKDSHHKRREWWAAKAESVGIDTRLDQWISRTAKLIHPTGRKPCKKCGQWMEIRYVYPGAALLKKLNSLAFLEEGFEARQTEDIFTVLTRFFDRYDTELVDALPTIFRQKGRPDGSAGFSEWLEWIQETLVPSEPRGVLSPGVMSNAPDRFDGFHSFNLCCRKTADSGRTKENLRTYTTDRRVFEYWAAGDWIAADRLMGIIRRDFRDASCLNGHPGPCQADHIGPISLGFNHQPYFQLLCGPCNSAKNNRMSVSDVHWLLDHEASGEPVISWHSQKVWDECKSRVESEENALRLSKILRDNRHSLMAALARVADAGHFAFLASMLELEHAEYNVEFENLRIEEHITVWDSIKRTARDTKYADEQKARRSRIAFGELVTYFSKGNRNAFVVANEKSEVYLEQTLAKLADLKPATASYDDQIALAVAADPEHADGAFRAIQTDYANFDNSIFESAMDQFELHMDEVGNALASLWEDDRFTRDFAPRAGATPIASLFE